MAHINYLEPEPAETPLETDFSENQSVMVKMQVNGTNIYQPCKMEKIRARNVPELLRMDRRNREWLFQSNTYTFAAFLRKFAAVALLYPNRTLIGTYRGPFSSVKGIGIKERYVFSNHKLRQPEAFSEVVDSRRWVKAENIAGLLLKKIEKSGRFLPNVKSVNMPLVYWQRLKTEEKAEAQNPVGAQEIAPVFDKHSITFRTTHGIVTKEWIEQGGFLPYSTDSELLNFPGLLQEESPYDFMSFYLHLHALASMFQKPVRGFYCGEKSKAQVSGIGENYLFLMRDGASTPFPSWKSEYGDEWEIFYRRANAYLNTRMDDFLNWVDKKTKVDSLSPMAAYENYGIKTY